MKKGFLVFKNYKRNIALPSKFNLLIYTKIDKILTKFTNLRKLKFEKHETE